MSTVVCTQILFPLCAHLMNRPFEELLFSASSRFLSTQRRTLAELQGDVSDREEGDGGL